MARSSRPPKPDAVTGRKLGRYEVGPRIAGGGMATVYLGRRRGADGIERLCALKVMRDDLARDTQYIQMFLDEARILSRLSSHPNIIQTYDYGVSDDGRYIAMELLLGRSLAAAWEVAVANQTHVPYVLAGWMCGRIADGLHYAHDLRDADGTPLEIVHRDVNPTNIFLTYDSRIKLIDFGLARSTKRESRSAEGIVKGKVPYLAPEQVTESTLDRRVDVYQLGATLWEITTGRRLFKRANDIETIRALQKHEIPDPRTVDPAYPERLWEIVSRALERRPEDRYPTAAALGEDLDTWVDAQESGGLLGPASKRWLESLFPGESAKEAAWLREVARRDRAPTATTMMPPAPVPAMEPPGKK